MKTFSSILNKKNFAITIFIIACLRVFAIAQNTNASANANANANVNADSSAQERILPTDAYELIRIARDMTFHNDYINAANIYCMATFANNRNAYYAVLTSMRQYFAEADTSIAKIALANFRECVLAPLDEEPQDTAPARDFLAAYYGRRGLFDLEISTLIELDTEESSSAIKLAELARTHIANRRYRFAASAAVAAHERLGEGSRKRDAATAAHRSYMFLGMRDSALVWLRNSGATSRDAQLLAVVLYQETGHFDEARALIDSLLPSFVRDTLLIRQMIFEGDARGAAQTLADTKVPRWIINANERRLWLARSLTFDGRAAQAIAIFDSIEVTAQWHAASEVLRYKYWSQKIFDDAILNALGKLEYFIYVNDLTAAARAFIGYNITNEHGEIMAIRVARELAKAQRFEEVYEVLSAINNSENLDNMSPEYLYFLAEALSKIGRNDEARVVVNKILTEFPLDIFSQKARVLVL